MGCGSSSLTETNVLENVNVGDRIRFTYDGGSEYGTRTVLVQKFDEESVEGPTEERGGEYRKYLVDNFDGDVEILDSVPAGHTLRVRFDEAGEKLLASLSGEQLANLYSQYVATEGDGAEFDSATGEVVVMLPARDFSYRVRRDYEVAGPILTINHPNGKTFLLYTYSDNTVGVHTDNYDGTEVTPQELADLLSGFVSQ